MSISSQLSLTCPGRPHQGCPFIYSCLNLIQMLGHCPITPVIFWTRKCGPRLMPTLSTVQLILPEFPISPHLHFLPISLTPRRCFSDLWQYETQNALRTHSSNSPKCNLLSGPSTLLHPYFLDWIHHQSYKPCPSFNLNARSLNPVKLLA